MGWVYQNNTTMIELADLGVLIDFSALPYQKHAGAKGDRGAGFVGYFDWEATGTAPYFPSKKDFRVPGERDDKLRIVELPMGILQSKLVGFLLEIRRAIRARSFSRFAKTLSSGGNVAKVSFPITFSTRFFRVMVEDILSREEDWLVTFFHADELLPDKKHVMNNLLYRADYFINNMQILLQQAAKAGRKVEFLTAAEAAEILRS